MRKNDENFIFMTIGPVYPYSTQRLNASENALEQMRTYLKQVRFQSRKAKLFNFSNKI